MNWQDIQLKEVGIEYSSCDCCAKKTATIDGDLWLKEARLGFYSAQFTEAHPELRPTITLYVGDFTDAGSPKNRWGIRVVWREEGCGLLDWPPTEDGEPRSFTELDRDDVLGSEFASDFWAYVDAIIMKDSRLEHFHSHDT